MKNIFLTLAFLLSFVLVQAQSGPNVFTATSITYYGIDFTNATFVGAPSEFPTNTLLKNKYFKEWNLILYSEKDKYNLAAAFKKDEVKYDLAVTSKVNESIDTTAIKHEEFGPVTKLTPVQIQQMVAAYPIATNTEGIGMVFIVESFDKNLQEGGSYVVFFDIASRTVLLSEYMVGKAKGFGLRNYWAGSFYAILGSIKNTEWKKWEGR